LQKALLTPLPSHPGLELVSRYVPGINGSEIGGDWYDAFRQPDGTLVAVVGDVVGHDIEAAAAMGHLRGVIRTIGHTTSASPAQTLARADAAAAGLQVRVIASAVVAAFREDGPGVFTVQWSCAGHPPAVLIRHGGEVHVLGGAPDVLLGVLPDGERHQFELRFEQGDTLVLYTDGLIERRDEDVDESVAKLAAHLAHTAQLPLDDVCDRALEQRPSRNTDDVALLAVRVRAAADGHT
jgi:serine phosphatase RsbU (regulator of sigma subunit)